MTNPICFLYDQPINPTRVQNVPGKRSVIKNITSSKWLNELSDNEYHSKLKLNERKLAQMSSENANRKDELEIVELVVNKPHCE
jgi:hypothetical protein